MHLSTALGLAAWGLLAATARGGPPLWEIESNNTFATADAIPAPALPVVAVEGFLGPDATPSGIDFLSFDVPAVPPLVTVSVFDYTPDDADNDSYLGLYHPSGCLTEVNDDGNPGFLSSIHFEPSTPGRWAAAVTGLGDFSFQGQGHNRQFDYRLVVSAGPSTCETGDNDTLATAQLLSPSLFVHGAAAVEGVLAPDSTPSGIDFYALEVEAGALVTASVFDFTPAEQFDTDVLLAVYGPDGSQFDFDETDGVDFLPAIHFFAPQTGTYTFALTGIGDYDFDGAGHGESFDYRLVISVPEPAFRREARNSQAPFGRRVLGDRRCIHTSFWPHWAQ